MLRARLNLFVGGVVLSASAIAASVGTTMYPDALLAAKRARISANLAYTVQQDIPAHAPPAYRRAAASRLALPLRTSHPLDFHAGGGVVTVPVEGLQFLDDLSGLNAWLNGRSCDALLLPNYLHRLARSNGRAADPLTAFAVRRADLLRDPRINQISDRYYHSASWFVLAHEVGHVALRHVGGRSGAMSIAQEQAADAFAIEVLRRRRMNPSGVGLFFIAASFYDPVGQPMTHPVSPDRIRAIARAMQATPAAFVAPESTAPAQDRATVLRIAGDLARLADTLQRIRRIQAGIAARGGNLAGTNRRVFPKTDFARACR